MAKIVHQSVDSDMRIYGGIKPDLEEVKSLLAEKAKQTDVTNSLALKIDKVTGKGLSTNDYDNIEKAEVAKVKNKADTTYVDTKVTQIVSGSPKGTYATLSALQTAFPTGTTGIYVVTADGKWYYWSGSAWSAGGTYQATALGKGSISPTLTSFFSFSSNLCNPADVVVGRLNSSGVLDTTQTGFNTSGYIDIRGNDGKYINSQNSGNLLRNSIFFYDSSYNMISGEYGTNTTAKVIPSGSIYVRVSIGTGSTFFIGISSDGTAMPYEAYFAPTIPTNYLTIPTVDTSVKDNSVKPISTTFIDLSRNLCDTSKIVVGRLNGSTGALDTTQTGYKTTDYMPVSVGNYVIPCHDLSNVLGYSNVIFYKSDLTFISGTFSGTTAVLVPANAKFARVSWDSSLSAYLYVEHNATSVSSGYVSYYTRLNTSILVPKWYENKKLTTFGDSITAQEKWQKYVVDHFQISSHVNRGIGGTTVSNNGSVAYIDANGMGVDPGTPGAIPINGWMCSDDRINTIPTDTDVLLVFGAHNDFGGSIALGTLESGLVDSTFKNATGSMIKKLIARLPNTHIVFMTPVGGRSIAQANQNFQDKNSISLTTTDYANAVKEVCMYYGIPCIDINAESGINTLNRQTYITDIVHPNDAGGKLIARAVINGMKRFTPLTF